METNSSLIMIACMAIPALTLIFGIGRLVSPQNRESTLMGILSIASFVASLALLAVNFEQIQTLGAPFFELAIASLVIASINTMDFLRMLPTFGSAEEVSEEHTKTVPPLATTHTQDTSLPGEKRAERKVVIPQDLVPGTMDRGGITIANAAAQPAGATPLKQPAEAFAEV